ncbi:MAG: peptidoglycan recognition family protein [Phycisphaerales bacterium]
MSRKAGAIPLASRARNVWVALLLSMTTVGGLLWVLQGAPAPRLDGLSLPAAVAAARPSAIETVFRTRAPAQPGRWQAIVIHHSGSPFGTASTIEAQHRAMNLQGLGHHFIVGNGSGMDDGDIHVGYRWLDQLPGAHAGGPRGDWLNRNAIGICLVGDGRKRAFTDQQVRRLAQLVGELSQRLDIPASRVYLHSDVAETDDPGRFFPEAAFREQLGRWR